MSNCNVIAISNQKGGVGKTTTTLSLGVALSKLGKKVLLLDADPQGDLTICMGYYEQEIEKKSQEKMKTIATLIGSYINDIPLDINDVILHHEENIDLIPSNLDLSAMEIPLLNAMNREVVIKNCLKGIKDKYDYILIDCMPSLGMITISRVKNHINPKLEVGGILLTLYDNRTNLSQEIKDEIKNGYGKKIKVYKSAIPVGVKVAKSTSAGKSIFSYDKNSRVADAYYQFAKEVDENGKEKGKNVPTIDR